MRDLKDKETKETAKTKSVYDRVDELDGERILVTRYWPRPYKKKDLQMREWLRELGPSPDLLRDWKLGISWQEYKRRYRKEIGEQQGKIEELAKRAKGRTITLLCFEAESDPHCHRHLLKEMIERASKGT